MEKLHMVLDIYLFLIHIQLCRPKHLISETQQDWTKSFVGMENILGFPVMSVPATKWGDSPLLKKVAKQEKQIFTLKYSVRYRSFKPPLVYIFAKIGQKQRLDSQVKKITDNLDRKSLQRLHKTLENHRSKLVLFST